MNECPICKAPAIQHSPNQLMECSLKKEIAALQKQLEPSPCGVSGHRNADWEIKKIQSCGCIICTCEDDVQCQGCGSKNCAAHDPMVAARDFHAYEYGCLTCRREQEIRREEREPICELFELWRTSSKRITFVDKESSVQWKRIWNSLVDKLTESGDYRALPEREAASRKEAK